MKKNLTTAICASVVFVAIFVSCQKSPAKDSSDNILNHSSKKFTIEDAKNYHQFIEGKFGNFDLITISGKTEKNFKRVDFSHAYTGETETSFYIEAPITYTKRQIVFSGSSDMPTSIIKKMVSKSFDRIVIYKDKKSGMVSEKILTVIPGVEYLSNDPKDLYNNHYQSVVKEFSGYLSYKSWKGQLLSTQAYNLGVVRYEKRLTLKGANMAKVADYDCDPGMIYTMYSWCEDYDEFGMGVNCESIIFGTPVQICDMVSPTFHNHTTPLPGVLDPYWDGFPTTPPQVSPEAPCDPSSRVLESPIVYASVSNVGSEFSLYFWDACFCQGYSWIIFENVATGVEYSVPISNQNFLIPGCNMLWETHSQLPANIPSGDYFIKVYLDGDVFYHQFEQNGTVIKRWKHTVL